MTTITIDAKKFRALTSIVNNKDVRFYMHGVHFYQSGDNVRAVATDGHALLDIEVSAGHTALDEGATIGLPQKKIAKGAEYVEINLSANAPDSAGTGEPSWHHMTVTTKSGATSYTTAPAVEGTFPDFERVLSNIDKTGTAESLRFNPDLIAGITAEYGQNGLNFVAPESAGTAIRIEISDLPGARCVIMPCRA
jgi:DNA polymerase III sliding clamp (beta) subunit (PCNA family)